MSPWLSILVPVYNVQDYLEECLTSVVEQLPQLQQSPNGVAGVDDRVGGDADEEAPLLRDERVGEPCHLAPERR